MPEKDVTFTATWKVDANGDGEPDDTETKYSITYSDGEAKGAAQGMPAKAENILSGTTQTISAAVPTWAGHVFAGCSKYGRNGDYRKLYHAGEGRNLYCPLEGV